MAITSAAADNEGFRQKQLPHEKDSDAGGTDCSSTKPHLEDFDAGGHAGGNIKQLRSGNSLQWIRGVFIGTALLSLAGGVTTAPFSAERSNHEGSYHPNCTLSTSSRNDSVLDQEDVRQQQQANGNRDFVWDGEQPLVVCPGVFNFANFPYIRLTGTGLASLYSDTFTFVVCNGIELDHNQFTEEPFIKNYFATYVALSHNNLGEFIGGARLQVPKLKVLNIVGSNITSSREDAFDQTPNLHLIDMTDNPLALLPLPCSPQVCKVTALTITDEASVLHLIYNVTILETGADMQRIISVKEGSFNCGGIMRQRDWGTVMIEGSLNCSMEDGTVGNWPADSHSPAIAVIVSLGIVVLFLVIMGGLIYWCNKSTNPPDSLPDPTGTGAMGVGVSTAP